MRTMNLSLLIALLLVVGVVGVTSADDEVSSEDWIVGISDGRVNHWEVAAPAAVYCVFDGEGEGATFAGVQVLDINAENNGELALSATADEIAAASADSSVNTLITAGNGYSLYSLTNGGLELTAPADSEGKVYSFVWQLGDQNC